MLRSIGRASLITNVGSAKMLVSGRTVSVTTISSFADSQKANTVHLTQVIATLTLSARTAFAAAWTDSPVPLTSIAHPAACVSTESVDQLAHMLGIL